MLDNLISTFNDPDHFRKAIGDDCKMLPGSCAGFEAELVAIGFDCLQLKRSRSSSPFTLSHSVVGGRIPALFLADANRAPVRINGVDLSPDDLLFVQPGGAIHARTYGSYRLASLSFTADEYARSSKLSVGLEFAVPRQAQLLRSPSAPMARLRAIHHAACEQARTAALALVHPTTHHALEQELVHAMVTCVAESLPSKPKPAKGPKVVAQFLEFVESRQFNPVYVAEICAAIGVSESALRSYCREQLGMGPIRYLWLRRMHLARRALLHADPNSQTVTNVATECGFWELGRFSVEYRALFGESPSDSLKRPH